jgi:hypothetical protein
VGLTRFRRRVLGLERVEQPESTHACHICIGTGHRAGGRGLLCTSGMAGLHGRFGIAILYSDGVSCGDWSMQVCAHEGQLSLFYTLFQPAELEMVVWRALPPSRWSSAACACIYADATHRSGRRLRLRRAALAATAVRCGAVAGVRVGGA